MKIRTEEEYDRAERRYAVLCMAGPEDDVDPERDELWLDINEYLDERKAKKEAPDA